MSKKRLLTRAEVDVDVWEERDRLSIVIKDKKTGQRTIAEWWDDDARQMFEDGFFKRGVELKRSVIAYAEEMGLISKIGRNPSVRKNIFLFNNPPSGPANADSARELELYIENDADLYRQQYVPIVKNLMLKRQKGIYDREKAVKLFMYLMESGAKKYIAQFSTPGQRIDTVFNKATREQAARSFRDSFEGEADLGNWDHLLVKVTTRGLKAAVARRGGADEFAQDMAAVDQGYRYKLIRRTKKYQAPGTHTTYAPIYAKSTYEIPKLQREWPGETWTIVDLASPRSTHENPRGGIRKNIFTFNNPRGGKQLECCQKLGPGASCVNCGKHTHFDVEWLLPSRAGDDHRTACSSRCALQIKKTPMSNPRKLNSMEQAANAVGLAFGTWAPGDGQTRYRFFLKSKGSPYADYHQGDGLYTALGRKDAMAFIAAFGKGRSARTNLKSPIYVIEGFTHQGRRGHSQRRAEFRTPSLAEARARAEQIFKETGVVVAITQRNPLTRGETVELEHTARRERIIGEQIQSPGSRGYALGHSDGLRHVVKKYGTYARTSPSVRCNPSCKHAHGTLENPYARGRERRSYQDFLARKRAEYGSKFDSSDLDPRFVQFYESGQRIWVNDFGHVTSGTVGVTTGWRPVFLLISSSRAMGSSTTLTTKTKILGMVGSYKPRRGEYGQAIENPLLQTVFAMNPPISAEWDRMGNRQRLELLGFVGYPDNFAVSYAKYPWVTLSDAAKRALERQWNDTGGGRSAGTTTRRRRLAAVGANPLTRREAGQVLRDARFDVRHGSTFQAGHTRSSRAGMAFGKAKVVRQYGPKVARRTANRISDEARKVARTTMSNPGALSLPAPGTKMTVAQAMEFARRIGDRGLIKECQAAARLQKTSDRNTKCVIWKHLPMGSKDKIDSVVALTHYGDSPEDMYRPPKGSKKGAHMFRHKWKRSVPVLASPSGKMIVKVMGPGQKVGDWMRG